MAALGCVALLGNFEKERLDLAGVSRSFAWAVQPVATLSELQQLCGPAVVVAVLIHTRTFPMRWPQAIKAVSRVAPGAKILLCHGAAESAERSAMIDQGAYHVLMLPLDDGEVRKALGFVADLYAAAESEDRSIASPGAA